MTNLVDSGSSWIGKVPAHWEISKIGHCFKHRNEIVSDKLYAPLSVTKNGVLPQLETAAKSDNSEGRKLIRRGDFVINQRSDRKGSAGVSVIDGSCSVIYTVLEPTKYHPSYAHHLFRSIPFQEEFYRWGTGIVDDLWSTRYSLMKQISCPVPPIEEQKAIADFLDRKLSRIDQLIAKQEAFIDLMQERRQAMIRTAVQRASRSNGAKLGHLKWYAKLRTGATPAGADYLDESAEALPWLRPDDLDETGNPSKGTRFFSPLDLVNSPKASPGTTLVCCIGATLGKAGYVAEGCSFNQQITSVETQKMNSRFLYYQLASSRDELRSLSMGNTLGILNNDRLGTLSISLPAEEVQDETVQNLDEKIPKLDRGILKARKLISLLREQKTSLVSAAVTGQLHFSQEN